jgi:hypothetical protein
MGFMQKKTGGHEIKKKKKIQLKYTAAGLTSTLEKIIKN